jgi:hypothetical protein
MWQFLSSFPALIVNVADVLSPKMVTVELELAQCRVLVEDIHSLADPSATHPRVIGSDEF